MRQLVSVVTDERIDYVLTDIDGANPERIASTINPGLEVVDVIELGVAMTDMLRLNGTKRAPKPVLHQPEPVVAIEPAPTVPKKVPRKKGPKPGGVPTKWGLGMQVVLDDIKAHPESTYADIAKRITGSDDRKAVGAATAQISTMTLKHGVLFKRGVREGLNVKGRFTEHTTLTWISGGLPD